MLKNKEKKNPDTRPPPPKTILHLAMDSKLQIRSGRNEASWSKFSRHLVSSILLLALVFLPTILSAVMLSLVGELTFSVGFCVC